jgi:hypothetical protein
VAWSGRDISLKGAAVDIVGASLRASRDLKITSTGGAVNFLTLTNRVCQSGYLNSYAQGAPEFDTSPPFFRHFEGWGLYESKTYECLP